MKTLDIAIYPGDGIGPEVMNEAIKVLHAVQDALGGFSLNLTRIPWGAAYWRETGRVVPENFLDVLRPFDALFLGALGDPAHIPDHITLEPLVRIRQGFDQYACVRPARLLPGVCCPLAAKKTSDIDLVVIRENSEGEYVNMGGRFKPGQPDELALQTAVHSRRGIERVLRFGFQLALSRRNRLTMITKSNAQPYAYGLWDEVLERLRPQFPTVSADKQHVDAAAMNLVRCPDRFDVVVASNLFGDILTDLSACIAGGLGLAPSANLNPERQFPSLFEPVHGSAPDIAGQGIANPTAAILSAAMMLDWLGLTTAANTIRQAVELTLGEGFGTIDLGGSLNTEQMAAEIIRRLNQD